MIDRISIVISVYNCDDLVKRCLDSLVASCGRLPETIVADNAASDSTRDLMASYDVKYLPMNCDKGFAGANNVGYQCCTKEFVVLVNSDTVFHEEPFSAMVKFLDENPKAAIVQGKVVRRNGVPGQDGMIDSCGGFLSVYGEQYMPGVGCDPQDERFSIPYPVYFAAGALFMFRNGIHERVGGVLFNDFFYAYYEETNLCLRAWLSGAEVWYVPTPEVEHVHAATFTKQYASVRLERLIRRNCLFTFLTCFGMRGYLMVLPLYLMFGVYLSMMNLLHGSTNGLLAFSWAVKENVKWFPRMLKVRRQVQFFRKASDREVFDKIIHHQPFIKYVRTAVRQLFCK